MAREEWAFTVAATDGAEVFGFSTKEDAQGAWKDIKEQANPYFISKVKLLVPGKTYWVVHVRRSDGRMQSFGFDTRAEALKFNKVLLKNVEGLDAVSSPTKAELNDDEGVLDWRPE